MRAALATLVGVCAMLCAAAPAPAQPTTSATPVYHGTLVARPAKGSFKTSVGEASLKVGPWPFALSSDSNGIFPDQEPIVISIAEDLGFYLPPGTLRPIRKGRSFVYRAKPQKGVARSVNMLRIDTQKDGTYLVRFRIRGLVLTRLQVEMPICAPFAVIVGDDDGFIGATFTRPSFSSPKLKLPSACEISTDDWPWIQE